LPLKSEKKPENPQFPPIPDNLTLNFWKVGLFFPSINGILFTSSKISIFSLKNAGTHIQNLLEKGRAVLTNQ